MGTRLLVRVVNQHVQALDENHAWYRAHFFDFIDDALNRIYAESQRQRRCRNVFLS